jgi:putative hydrolase of the HAD superfamily
MAGVTDIQVLLLDLDGVVRLFDPDITSGIERGHGIAAGAIHRAAFAPDRLRRLNTGALTRADWITEIGVTIGAKDAADEWSSQPVGVNIDVLDAARALRRRGVRVCLLTNGSDLIMPELETLGIAHDFDVVFNSADIGYAKPDLEIFVHVLSRLGVPGPAVLYVDDISRYVRSAAVVGIRGVVYRSVDDLTAALRVHSLLPA